VLKFHRFEKALISSAFFIASFLTHSSHAANKPQCAGFIASTSAVVRYIHDGDTLFLQDNRKLRLIGIDSPELASRNNNSDTPSADQPFAIAARDYARDLIRHYGQHVKLMPGIEASDHYGRQLFHIQLSDGSLLQARLLQAGLAVAYVTPPNHRLSPCYRKHEQQAQAQQLNIWADSHYRITPVPEITDDLRGFRRIRGRVRQISESKKAVWINFYGNFSARIDKTDLPYFTSPLAQLLEKEVTVRGWLHHYHNKAQLRLRHPTSIETQ